MTFILFSCFLEPTHAHEAFQWPHFKTLKSTHIKGRPLATSKGPKKSGRMIIDHTYPRADIERQLE